MNSQTYRFRFFILIFALSLTSSNLFGDANPTKILHDKGPVKVGVIIGLTGPAQSWGEFGRKAMNLAMREVNSKGGINGKQLELVIEDSGSDPKQAVSAYKKLTSIDEVEAIVGDVWAFLTNPLIPLSERDKLPLISPLVIDVSVENPGEFFFTFGPKVDLTREATELFFEENPHIRTVSILCWDDPWGESYLRVWRSVIEKRRLNVLNQFCVNDFNYDYRTEIAKISKMNPDAVLVAYHQDQILKRLRENKLTPRILTPNGFFDFWRKGNIPKESGEGVFIIDWIPEQSFTKSFKDHFNEPPLFEAQNHYEAVKAIARALESSPNDLVAGLRSLRYQGATGLVDFTADFSVNHASASLRMIRDGEVTTVR